ncbi:MAG: hypothetical protein PWQ70_2202 [Clostridiales bacterium]|nr:hypothetical protein [Clostridiales bacterium]
MTEQKRLYSLNLAAYLLCKGFNNYKIFKDAETNKYYFIFPQSPKIAEAIKKYKNGEKELHKFLQAYKQIRLMIQKAEECENG